MFWYRIGCPLIQLLVLTIQFLVLWPYNQDMQRNVYERTTYWTLKRKGKITPGAVPVSLKQKTEATIHTDLEDWRNIDCCKESQLCYKTWSKHHKIMDPYCLTHSGEGFLNRKIPRQSPDLKSVDGILRWEIHTTDVKLTNLKYDWCYHVDTDQNLWEFVQWRI